MSASLAKPSAPSTKGNSVAEIFESMSYGPAPEADDAVQVSVFPAALVTLEPGALSLDWRGSRQ